MLQKIDHDFEVPPYQELFVLLYKVHLLAAAHPLIHHFQYLEHCVVVEANVNRQLVLLVVVDLVTCDVLAFHSVLVDLHESKISHFCYQTISAIDMCCLVPWQ